MDFSYDDVPFITFHSLDIDHGPWVGYAWREPPQTPFCDELTTEWSCVGISPSGENASVKAPRSSMELVRVAYTAGSDLYYYQPGWGPVMVDFIGTSLETRGVSMQIDNDGYPVIAYQKIQSDFSLPELWLARPYLAYDDNAFGNCGQIPPGMVEKYWRCTPLDVGNQYVSEAQYASLVVNNKGRLAIAYSEYDEYDYFMSAKFIYQFLYSNFLPITRK